MPHTGVNDVQTQTELKVNWSQDCTAFQNECWKQSIPSTQSLGCARNAGSPTDSFQKVSLSSYLTPHATICIFTEIFNLQQEPWGNFHLQCPQAFNLHWTESNIPCAVRSRAFSGAALDPTGSALHMQDPHLFCTAKLVCGLHLQVPLCSWTLRLKTNQHRKQKRAQNFLLNSMQQCFAHATLVVLLADKHQTLVNASASLLATTFFVCPLVQEQTSSSVLRFPFRRTGNKFKKQPVSKRKLLMQPIHARTFPELKMPEKSLHASC